MSDNEFLWEVTAPCLAMIFFVLLGSAWALQLIKDEKRECANKWSKSGIEVKYEEGVGCLIKYADNRWMPEEFLLNK